MCDSVMSENEKLQIYSLAKVIRQWLVDHYGDGVNMAGHCIEASELLVNLLHIMGVEHAHTQAGYVRYDDDRYAEQQYEPHMWVEVPSKGSVFYLDITADQFNYGMDPENKFSAVIFRRGRPRSVFPEQSQEV